MDLNNPIYAVIALFGCIVLVACGVIYTSATMIKMHNRGYGSLYLAFQVGLHSIFLVVGCVVAALIFR